MPKEVPINEVINLSKQGYTDADIIRYLREQGYSPTQINDAINRAKIKIELEKTAGFEGGEGTSEYEYIPKPLGEEMSPSILSQETPVETETDVRGEEYGYYAPIPTEASVEAPIEEAPAEEAAVPVGGAEGYPYPSYEIPAAPPTESVEELAEEIISEKWREFIEQVGDVAEFKRYIELRIKSVEERIARLESSFDKLQAVIMERVENYGRGIRALGSEVQALEGAFGKIVEPLTSSVKELKELSEELKLKTPKTTTLAESLEKQEKKIKETTKKKK